MSKGSDKGRYWPSFDSPFLEETAVSLRKRSKAINYRTDDHSCERVRERRDDWEGELMELRFDLLGPRPFKVSCNLWSDRWLWIDVRQPSKQGWLFEWQHEGRIGDAAPRELAEAIEETLAQIRNDDPAGNRSRLEHSWAKIALKEPIGP